MTELKTLKDLEEKGLLNGYDHGEFSLVHVPKLKAEAVKWVKFYQCPNQETEETRQRLRMFIIKFFNLTKEDLK